MFQVVIVVAMILGSLAIASLTRERQKEKTIPFSLGYRLAVVATIGTVAGFFHFAFTAFGFVIVMIGCNGFPRQDLKRNPAATAFLVFYLYMIVVACFGLYPVAGICDYMISLMTYASGYFTASWACRTEGGLRKVLGAALVASFVIVGYALIHGGFAADVVHDGARGVLAVDLIDEEGGGGNPNYTALTLDCTLPFLLILLLMPARTAKENLYRMLSAATFIAISLLLVRTGSRNGCLSLLPCAWYFVYSTRHHSVRMRRIALGLVVLAIGTMGVFFTMRQATEIRAFHISTESRGFDSAMDALTTGRWGFYQACLDKMSPMEKIFGKGFSLDVQDYRFNRLTGVFEKVDRPRSQNYHSMYVTIFIRSGAVGSLLFLIFLIKVIAQAMKCGDRGRMAILLLGGWMLPGVGEAWGIGQALAILAGFATGLVSLRPALNSELQCSRDLEQLRFRGYEWQR